MVKPSEIGRHALIWIIFISYEIACIHFTVGLKGTLIDFIAYYALYITLFYVNAHVVLNLSFFKTAKPYLSATLLIAIEIIVFTILKIVVDHFLLESNSTFKIQFHLTQAYLLANIFREIFFIGFSIAYWSMLYMIRFKDANHEMEKTYLRNEAHTLELENRYIVVENAYLQNQISPHLLFNSLNFIYNQVYKESEKAGESVALLAELMRYSLVSADDSRTVPLSQEVRQVENLIELCKLRFSGQFFLRFKKKGKLADIRIIPLILITLVENMMKHGDLGDRRQRAQILLEIADGCLAFATVNKVRNTGLYPKGGLGLKNIEKRLSNYYPGRYTLQAGKEDDLFKVNLMIEL